MQAVVGAVVAAVVVFIGVSAALLGVARARVSRTWQALDDAIEERRTLAERLGDVVRSYVGDDGALRQLAAASTASAEAAGAGRGTAELQFVGALRGVVALATEYPELRGDPAYSDLSDALERAERSVEVTAEAYGRHAVRLNRRRRRLALRPTAALLRVRPAPAFDPGAAGRAP